MSVKIIDNTLKIKLDTTRNASLFLRLVADGIVNASTPHTPKKLGNLRRDVLKQVLGLSGKVVWRKNYANILETKQFSHYTTSGTGPHFAEQGVETAVSHLSEYAKKANLI